jgi:hypothetical protein
VRSIEPGLCEVAAAPSRPERRVDDGALYYVSMVRGVFVQCCFGRCTVGQADIEQKRLGVAARGDEVSQNDARLFFALVPSTLIYPMMAFGSDAGLADTTWPNWHRYVRGGSDLPWSRAAIPSVAADRVGVDHADDRIARHGRVLGEVGGAEEPLLFGVMPDEERRPRRNPCRSCASDKARHAEREVAQQ